MSTKTYKDAKRVTSEQIRDALSDFGSVLEKGYKNRISFLVKDSSKVTAISVSIDDSGICLYESQLRDLVVDIKKRMES